MKTYICHYKLHKIDDSIQPKLILPLYQALSIGRYRVMSHRSCCFEFSHYHLIMFGLTGDYFSSHSSGYYLLVHLFFSFTIPLFT